MKNKHIIIGAGEILWDILPGGKKLGGAPTNFCYHASRLDADSYILSSVGKDSNGKEILKRLCEMGLKRDFIQENGEYPTGTVDVILDEKGIPSYVIHEDTAWDNIVFKKEHREIVINSDALCFGTLGQRSKVSGDTIRKILHISLYESKKDALRVFDINIRQNFFSTENILESLRYCNILKINEDELPLLKGLLDISAVGHKDAIKEIIKRFELKLIALTLGKSGSILASAECISHTGIYDLPVRDTVGAGDAFTAAVVEGVLRGMDIDEINRKAAVLAGFVCSMEGGTPEYNEEMRNLFN